MTSTSPPDAIRLWFIDHPNVHARPADIAHDTGLTVHRSANTLIRLLDAGELVRFRPTDQTGKSGPGVRYAAAEPYRAARSLTEWVAARARVLAAKKEARRP